MASTSTRRFTCCVLLVYGIPGSGKSMLTDYLCSESVWSMMPIHFDSFYPPDTRVTPSLEELETSEKDMSPFGMKRERQRVSECIERLIQLSTADGSVEPNTESPPQLWDTFMSHVCQNHGHLLHHHKDGKFCLPSPCVLVLDDNLPLRSMRYPFYQMAKKYQLGFAELCVCCEVGVAHARNHDRRIPIPNSTIINMEQRLELPEPIKHHWERRSSVLLNNCNKEEFLTSALVTAKELISEALAHPEQQMASGDSEMKETCRSENLENYLHQADIILRKCVSAAISEYTGSETGRFAKSVNSIRRELLEETRTSGLVEQFDYSATTSEYESRIQQLFHAKLNSQCHV